MSPGGAQQPDAEMERQWRIWKAKGVKLDRRRAVVIGRVSWVVGIAMVGWLVALMI
jgi:hypothetical protein